MNHNAPKYQIRIDHQTVTIADLQLVPYLQLRPLPADSPHAAHGTHALVTPARSIYYIADHTELLNRPHQPATILFYITRGATAIGAGNGRKYLWLDQPQPAIWEIAPGMKGIPTVQKQLHLIIRQHPQLSHPTNLQALEQIFGQHLQQTFGQQP